MLSSVKDDAKVKFVPTVLGEQALEVFLDLLDGFPRTQFPALRQPMNMRVHREGGDPEGLGHDDRGGLVADAGKLLEFFKGSGALGRRASP